MQTSQRLYRDKTQNTTCYDYEYTVYDPKTKHNENSWGYLLLQLENINKSAPGSTLHDLSVTSAAPTSLFVHHQLIIGPTWEAWFQHWNERWLTLFEAGAALNQSLIESLRRIIQNHQTGITSLREEAYGKLETRMWFCYNRATNLHWPEGNWVKGRKMWYSAPCYL